MARMLEALKQARKPILRIAEIPPPPVRGLRALPDEAPPTLPAPVQDAVSYIEVGGRGEPIEASADVLACPGAPTPAAAVASPAAPKPAPEAPACPPAVSTTATIRFRALQAEAVTLAPGPARFAPQLVAFHRPHDPAAEQYAKLLASIDSQAPQGARRVLYFTAATPGAGTTTTCLNLAIVLARSGSARVVVVDANQRHPAVAERLGLRAVPGLAEVLAGDVALHQVLQETAQPNLHVVTAGRARPAAGLRLAGGSFGALLGQLRERYDRVIIDGPSWDSRPETVAISSACDAVYLVLRGAEEETPEVANLLRSMPQQGSRLQGCIVTPSI
jgi:Mrp family chromosome partitioning ATPase